MIGSLLRCAFLAGLLALPSPSGAQNAALSPWPKAHFDDNNGAPCSGCKVFTYTAGTTTKTATYTDSTAGTPNINPIILDSRGEANIWLAVGTYKFTLSPSTDSDPPTAPIWTVDNIPSSLFSSLAISGNLTVTGNTDLAPATAALSALNPDYFPTYSQLTGIRGKLSLSGAISDTAGSFRDTLYIENDDSDTTVYTLAHANIAGVFAAYGPSPGSWQTSYKNIIGVDSRARAATSSAVNAGVAAFLGSAVQFGTGIADNEFVARNPAAADGGTGQSVSMAPVQAVLNAQYADTDGSHVAWNLVLNNISTKLTTGGISMTSAVGMGYGIAMNNALVTTAAITMPKSAAGGACSGTSGTIIDYGLANGNPAGGSYTGWNCAVDGGQYFWTDGGAVVGTLGVSGLTPTGGIGAAGGFATSPRNVVTCGGSGRDAAGALTDQTPVATEVYIAEVFVPANMTVTGVAVFNGSVVSGNMKVGLANSSGVNVATSASTAASGAQTYQLVPFTAPYAAKGPATYYVETFYDNATQRANALKMGACGTAAQTGQTFATGFTTITPPTTFTANVGPAASLY